MSDPKSEGEAPPALDTVATLRRLNDLEREDSYLRRVLSNTQDTNRFILIVLFVGFVAIVITIVIFAITTIVSDTNSRTELIQQLKELNSKTKP
jgi:hypothetical protein